MLFTRVMPRFSSFGAFVASGEYWNLAPYVGAIHLWGECWGRLGTGCWKRYRDLLTELGMETSTYFSGYFQSMVSPQYLFPDRSMVME